MESIMSVIPAVVCPSPPIPTLNAHKYIKEDLYWLIAQDRIVNWLLYCRYK